MRKNKDNYISWDININDFPYDGVLSDKLKFFIRFGILAPSGHNSQPWYFVIEDNSIIICPDYNRALSKSDPERRQLLITIGCAISNILTASNYFGLGSVVEYITTDSNIEGVKIKFDNKQQMRVDASNLVEALSTRRTNRYKYVANQLPDTNFLNQWQNYHEDNTRMIFINDYFQKNSIVDIIIESGVEAMDDVSFRQELSHYIKSNWTKSKFGMPGFSLNIPAPASLVASWMIRFFNMSKLNKKSDEKILREHTPLFGIICTKNDNQEDWVNAGRLFCSFSNTAEEKKLAVAPFAAPIQKAEYRGQIKKILSFNYTPQIIFRFGYPSYIPGHTPRMLVEDLLK